MASTGLNAATVPEPLNFRERMVRHTINGVRRLGSEDPIDAGLEVTSHIHSLASYMSAAVEERHGAKFGDGERPLERLNPEILVGAFYALAWLGALADFYLTEAAGNYKN